MISPRATPRIMWIDVGKTANLVMIRAIRGDSRPYCLMNGMIWGLGFWLNEVLSTRSVVLVMVMEVELLSQANWAYRFFV